MPELDELAAFPVDGVPDPGAIVSGIGFSTEDGRVELRLTPTSDHQPFECEVVVPHAYALSDILLSVESSAFYRLEATVGDERRIFYCDRATLRTLSDGLLKSTIAVVKASRPEARGE
jgi:hypothetical protein